VTKYVTRRQFADLERRVTALEGGDGDMRKYASGVGLLGRQQAWAAPWRTSWWPPALRG